MSHLATVKADGIDAHVRYTDTPTRRPATKDRVIESLLPLA